MKRGNTSAKRKPLAVVVEPVVRFLDGFIWLRIDALDNAVLRWRRIGKYRRWWEPRHAPLRLLRAALVYAWMPFYRRAKTEWQIHESNLTGQAVPHETARKD